MPPKSKWCSKSKVNVNVLSLSDKVKMLDSLKSGIMGNVGYKTEIVIF
jgi:hypothetical protein